MGCRTCERSGDRIDFLTQKITSYEQLYTEILKGHKLFVLEESVIDISAFSMIHPGSSSILHSLIGIIMNNIVKNRKGN